MCYVAFHYIVSYCTVLYDIVIYVYYVLLCRTTQAPVSLAVAVNQH